MERYDRLLAWALKLTDHDHQRAEDLVHDVFVKFAMTQPDLYRIENLDAYLYTALRNTYRSQLSRAGYDAVNHPKVLDFDSAELWLRRAEHRQAFQTQEELYLICRYVCLRKETAKAASVLILRYFLGYFPSEIARILICARQAAAELLRVARVEARLFVDDPKRLGFVNQDMEPIKISGALPTEDLLAALRRQIFNARSGECLTHDLLREHYLNGAAQAIDRRFLAHLVSCPRCLDEVNRILGLPLLEDRNPTDTTGNDPGSKGGAAGGEAGAIRRLRRRSEQVYHHDPKELRIVVDGRLLGSQEITAEVNKQTLSLSEAEPDTFIEIYSEQDLRLAYLIVEELPLGVLEQHEVVELSDDRRIEIDLNFKGVSPQLQIVHHQPASPPPPPDRPIGEARTESGEERALLLRLLGLRRWLFWPQIAAGGAILIAAWLIYSLFGNPSAAELLERASISEASFRQTVAAEPDRVFHQTFEIEETRSDKSVVAHRRLEVWQNAGKRLEVRRLYDENGILIAGEWKTMADGKTEAGKLYRRISRLPESGSVIEARNLWRLDLSASGFAEFAGHPTGGKVEAGPRGYIVSYQNPSPGLAGASLTIDRRSNRSIGQQFIFSYSNGDRVVQFSEKNFQRRPLDATLEPVFQVDAELSEVTNNAGNSQASSTASSVASVAPAAPVAPVAPVLSEAELTNLEIKALMLLHRIDADLGEEVSLTHSKDGKLEIEAIVEKLQRKNQILASLAPMFGRPAVIIRVETVAEALRVQKKKRAIQPSVQEYDATAGAIPAEPELRAYFSNRLANPANEEIEAEIRKFAIDIFNRSKRSLLFAYALKRLAGRFSNDDLSKLDGESRSAWHSMVAAHAQKLSTQTAEIRKDLQPVFAPASGGAAASVDIPTKFKDDADLLAAVKQVFEWEVALDRDLRSAFIAGSQTEKAQSVKTVKLLRDLLKVEKLSTAIYAKSANNNNR